MHIYTQGFVQNIYFHKDKYTIRIDNDILEKKNLEGRVSRGPHCQKLYVRLTLWERAQKSTPAAVQ